MIWAYVPHTINVDAFQSTYLNQQSTAVALGGTALSTNLAFAPTSQTILVVGR
jgi:hypothetical protein